MKRNVKVKAIAVAVILILVLGLGSGCIRKKEIKQNPVVTMEIQDWGTVKIELYPKIAPNTVDNFISLTKSGFYDGLIFHRIIAGFMIQGGDPDGNGAGGPGYSIKGEFSENGFKNDLLHETGVISMARGENSYDSAGSQFFIMVADKPDLDGGYAAFGKVIEGMDIVEKISDVDTDEGDRPYDDVIIKKVTVDTFGYNYPEPKKIR
jgi:peptidyl-prolyl cis-trans isomerase B (cyclophilin B)